MQNNRRMDITLTPEQEKAAEALVKAGRFESKAAAIAYYSPAGLKDDADKLAALKTAIAVGVEQADRGETHTLDADETIARLRKRIAERSADKLE